MRARSVADKLTASVLIAGGVSPCIATAIACLWRMDALKLTCADVSANFGPLPFVKGAVGLADSAGSGQLPWVPSSHSGTAAE